MEVRQSQVHICLINLSIAKTLKKSCRSPRQDFFATFLACTKFCTYLCAMKLTEDENYYYFRF